MITKKIDHMIRKARCFGLKLYLLKILNILWSYEKQPNKATWWLWEMRCKETYNWLIKHYSYVIERHKNDHIDQTNIEIPRRIWTMWWQGEENAPEIVKMCISSMRMNFDEEVIVLTKDNFRRYVEIPEHILLKLDQGKMSLTHFSDIIRMNLLRKWGGCWLDATMLMVDRISSDVFAMRYYTAKLQKNRTENISYNEFSGFLIFEVQGGLLSSFASDFFSEYWKNEDYLIDYFLIDYVTRIAIDHITEFKKAHDTVPLNNPNINVFPDKLNEAYDEEGFNKLCKETDFFKCTWKKDFQKKDSTGKDTLYGYLLHKYCHSSLS